MPVRAVLEQEDAVIAAVVGDPLDVERDVPADVHEHHRARALFRAPGALFSFELAADVDVLAFLNRLRIVVLSSNLGDHRTLAIPVARTIYWEMGAERRAEMGIADSLVRVSVGIEDTEDLIADFAQALA